MATAFSEAFLLKLKLFGENLKMKMRQLHLFVAIFFLGWQIHSQELIWEKTTGGTDTDWLHYAFQNSKGNYIFSGYSYSDISGDQTEEPRGQGDFWIVETNPQGQLLWQKRIGGSAADAIFKIVELKDGTYLLAGISYSGISGEKTETIRGLRDLWLVKLDSQNNISWQRTYGGDGYEDLTDLIVTSDGGYLAVVNSNSTTSGDKTAPSFGGSDLWVLKLNSEGLIEWQETYGGDSIDSNGQLHETPQGNFVIAASSASGLSGNKAVASRGLSDYWLFEIDPSGNIIWQKTYGGDNGDHLSALVSTPDGGFLIAGDSASEVNGDKSIANKGGVDLWLVKTDGTGTIEWQKVIGGNSTEWLADLDVSGSGGYIISAMSASNIGFDKTESNRGNRDYWIVKISDDGEICWDKTLGGNSLDNPMSGFEDSDGNFVLGGWSDSNTSGDKKEDLVGVRDFWVTKISQPDVQEPVVNIPDRFRSCDRNSNGYAEFELDDLDQSIVGDQDHLRVQYFDHNWNPMPSPLPRRFTNTVKNGQVINVRVIDTRVRCAKTEFQIFLEVEGCSGDGDNDNVGFPKFFTPNNDGHNDTWRVEPTVASRLNAIYIFDRFGKLLQQLPPNSGWDGMSSGRHMPSDDYWFKALTKENEEIRGHFSLIRSN